MVYAKKVETTDSRFTGRQTVIFTSESETRIDVPDTVVLCNGCNANIFPNPGYLVYLDRRELKADRPYDIYCEACLKKYFPTWRMVG